ncbi:hypothetical protein HPB50_028468 [Hyalomma asiaticum]|nr:hypothetical protein HPB50_028468 [Hyalomma asiaticum]
MELYASRHPHRPLPTRPTFIDLFRRFCTTGSVHLPRRTTKAIVDEDIEIDVVACVTSMPELSIRQIADKCGRSIDARIEMAPSGSHLSKKTAKERAREYKHADFYEDGEQLTIAASRLLTSTSGAAVIVRMPKQGTPLSEKVAKNNQKTERGVQERRESKVDCKRWNPQSRLVKRGTTFF